MAIERGLRPVAIVVANFFICLVTTFPTVQQYIYSRLSIEHGAIVTDAPSTGSGGCGEGTSNDGNLDSKENEIQKAASRWTMIFGAAVTFPSCMTLLFLGNLGDVKGRRIAMLLPLFGSMVRVLASLAVIAGDLDLRIMMYGFLLEGFCGGYLMFTSSVFAYLSDISKDQKTKTQNITLIEGLIGVSVAIGQLFTAFVVKATGYFLPVFLVACLLAYNIHIVLTKMPESVKEVSGAKLLRVENIRQMFKIYTKKRSGSKQKNLVLYLVVLSLTQVISVSRATLETMFQLRSPLCWNSVSIGVYKTGCILLHITVMIVLFKPLQKKLDNVTMAMIGAMSAMAGLAFEAFVSSSTMMYMVPMVGFLEGFVAPMCKGVFSNSVDGHEQGLLFASQGCVQTFGIAIGQVFTSAIYMSTVSYMPGFVFLIMAGFYILAIVLLRNIRNETQTQEGPSVVEAKSK